ncbi:glutaredoxin family protein [Aliikangiella sp. G2MR2-5]|uniref:glutaredoxin family protein n=1 Tax=Aliikangiella sp. G2MR2-5 TaxID=2788943 RepID=UPI0018AB7865|nr:glutaredoxin family protein [Aliikangiella sp. G2MR2-5]
MTETIQLFTTAGCHLCEQAEAMFEYLVKNDKDVSSRLTMLPVEIAGDEALVERYGVRIPVLAKSDQELGWPFELEELKDWLLK